MRQFFFISLAFSFFACNDAEEHKKKTGGKNELQKNAGTTRHIISYNDTVQFPYRTETDSGYFRGYLPERIDSLEPADTSMLFKAISGIISKKDIILLGEETLSHSVLINQKSKTRFDTLKNSEATVTSVYTFGKKEVQIIKINGKVVKPFSNREADDEDVLDIDHSSFRHFSFKGRAFYYMTGYVIDHACGGSIGNLNFHLLYDIETGKLSIFTTCRWRRILLFGDANGDDKLDLLDFNNDDFCTSIPYSDTVKLSLYSCDKKGNFVLQKDAAGRPWFISANTGCQYSQDSLNIKKYCWPVPISR